MTKPVNHRYQVLDSLRGICACMVVLYHFHTVGWISNLPLLRNGWLFVDFFFVLSGFVITTAYRSRLRDGLPIRSFMWLRLGRIYPVHLVVTGLFVAVQLVLLVQGGKAFQRHSTVEELIASLTLTQTFLLPSAVVWNGPSWSIAVEMWTYLLFAAIFRVFSTRNGLGAACASICAASFAYIALVQGGSIENYHFGAFLRCTYGFALGVIGAEFRPLLQGRRTSMATVLEFTAVGIAVVAISLLGSGSFTLWAPPVFLVLVLVFANEGGAIALALKSKLFLLLGELSYSIYMVHLFILYRLSGLTAHMHKAASHPYLLCETDFSCSATGSPLLADALIVPVLIIVVGAAYLLRNLVENPCERWAKAALFRRTQAAGSRAEIAAMTSNGATS